MGAAGVRLVTAQVVVPWNWPTPWTVDLPTGNREINVTTILLIVLILLLLGVVPAWPHSRGWGYGPSGIVGILVIILILMLVTGRL